MTTITNGGWIEEIPQVEIELMANGNVRLTDKTDMNGDHMVDLHPIHLRLIAERLGLVGAMSDTEAQALRTVDKLVRRLRVLHERIEQLDKWLCEQPDYKEADIDVEVFFSGATLDLSREFQLEIEESGAVVTPMSRTERGGAGAATVGAQKTPENGGVQYPRKRGSSAAPQQLDLGGCHD